MQKSVIFLVDINSFFVSCELIRKPELKKKPLVIASRSKRSVISAASYAAKNLGVDSAMPLQTALMKYPQLEV
ncbi:MAG: DNA polymerase IV, partial [Culicoidibacterales bacterium]